MTVLRIRFILIWIRIRRSVSWNNGTASGSGFDLKSKRLQLFRFFFCKKFDTQLWFIQFFFNVYHGWSVELYAPPPSCRHTFIYRSQKGWTRLKNILFPTILLAHLAYLSVMFLLMLSWFYYLLSIPWLVGRVDESCGPTPRRQGRSCSSSTPGSGPHTTSSGPSTTQTEPPHGSTGWQVSRNKKNTLIRSVILKSVTLH